MMVLVDSSIWIDHLRKPIPGLTALLDKTYILSHPLVIGEVAMGSLKDRTHFLRFLQKLPKVQTAHDAEVMSFIETEALHGLGIGYIDVHLLAATRLSPDARLWTRDKRLNSRAVALGLGYSPVPKTNAGAPPAAPPRP